MLGRPFGAPDKPDFQRDVLHALLKLFERDSGPVLEDYPDDAPAGAAGDTETAFACPVSFARAAVDDGDCGAAMQREIAQLAPWYDLAKKRRGRSTVGISGLRIGDAAKHASSYLGTAPATPYAGLSAGVALKRACDDIKAFYYEAVAAQPGNLQAKDIERWFWHETVAARVFLEIQQVCLKSSDKSMQPLGKISLVPRAVQHRLEQAGGKT